MYVMHGIQKHQLHKTLINFRNAPRFHSGAGLSKPLPKIGRQKILCQDS